MNEYLKQVITAMESRFNTSLEQFREESSLIVKPAFIVPLLTALRDEFQFDMLMDVTAVDYFPQETPRFHAIYQLCSMQHNLRIQVRALLDGNAPSIDTVESIYPSANWKEREVYDLFGILFVGHSDLRRIQMPEDWVGHPLRKDYPLGYEEVQFTFNFEDIMRNKPQAKD